MRVAFRVDASYVIGSGHVMRCLTLADCLAKSNHQSLFICRDHQGNLVEHIRGRGHETVVLSGSNDSVVPVPADTEDYRAWLGVGQGEDVRQTREALSHLSPGPDWLVVDHYALDRNWHSEMRRSARRLFVIDDLANRPHDCDMLLDHNLSRRGSTRYDALVPEHCRRLLGPEYSLLREEFVSKRAQLRTRDGSVRNVLVFFGGVDSSGETLKTCAALEAYAGQRFTVTVIAGTANPRHDEIEKYCAEHRGFVFFQRVMNMADLMADADLAFGTGGTTTWERAYLGLPTIAVWVAENQREGTEAMADQGALWSIGRGQDIGQKQISTALERALDNPDELRSMSQRALGLSGPDPEPAAQRVVRLMGEGLHA